MPDRDSRRTISRVILVHNGRLKYDGTPAEMRQSKSLEEMFYQMTDYGHMPVQAAAAAGPVGEGGGHETES